MSTRRALGVFGACSAHIAFCLGVGCTPAAQSPNIAVDENAGPLANVILLPLTTRSTDDLLGHAWSAEIDLADPLRTVLTGTMAVTSTDQHTTFFRELTAGAEVNANLAVASGGAHVSHVTHVLYDVRITAIAALESGTQRYNPECGCCLQGNPTEDCQVGYVYRLLRGSGSIKMLQRITGEANANIKNLIVTRAGANYKLVDESTFNDAYFGLELMPLQSICRTLTPEQEMAPLQLKSNPNCVIQRYSALGDKETLAKHLPSDDLCRTVAEHYCNELSGVLSCRVRFGNADEADMLRKPATPAPEPTTNQSPTPDVRSRHR